MLRDLLSLNVFGFFLIFARIGTAFSLMPGFSAAYVPERIRLLFALAVSFVVAPILIPEMPVPPATVPGLFLLVGGEILIGGFFGAMGRIIMGAMHTTGTLIAYLSSMANAFINDPIAEQQGSIISGFLTTIALVLIFVTGLHQLMLRAVIDSYTLFVPGQPLIIGDFAHMVTRHVADAFLLGVQLASPFLLTAITHYLMLGILGRLMPNLPVFFFGLPIQIMTQISVLALVLSSIMLMFVTRFSDTFGAFLAP